MPLSRLGRILSRKYATEVIIGLLDRGELSPQGMRNLMGPSQHSTAMDLARFLASERVATIRTVRGQKRDEEYRVRLTAEGTELARGLRRIDRALR